MAVQIGRFQLEETKGATRIVTSSVIRRPAEQIYNYVSDPANWPSFHPSSLSVTGATGHSLQLGEQVVEEFLVAGRRGRITWTVVGCEPNRRWAVAGRIEGRQTDGIVAYYLEPHPEGTLFRREFQYSMPGLLAAIINRLLLRPRAEAESREAVYRLKTVLEQS